MAQYHGRHEIVAKAKGSRVIAATIVGVKELWSAVSSCFGSGVWRNDKPWSNKEAWRN